MHYLTISKFILPLVKERLAGLQPSGEKQLPLFDLKKVSRPTTFGIITFTNIHRTTTSSGQSPMPSPTGTRQNSHRNS